MKSDHLYAAKHLTPFALLGIRVDHDQVSGIDFLALGEATLAPSAKLP